jgi:aryl-alcohol dehydrogenase-like predicted oxidoreductase
MSSINKLVLGTVQFGLNYGVNNQTGQVTTEEVNSILSLANKEGIEYLDTSYAYGDSENSLGQSFRSNNLDFNIISKYPESDKSVQIIFEESLARLGKDKIYGYLVHHFDYYRLNPEIWADFVMLKNQGKVSKIGFSIYSIEQLQYLFDNNVAFDLIQFPYNIFDRQFEPYLSKLKNMGVEIHTRSVFLQGLFFKDLSTLDGKLSALKPYLSKLHQYCETKGISVTQLALNYVLNNQFIDGVLIGVDSVEQLKCNIDVLDSQLDNSTTEFVDHINIKEKELLNPVNWK